MEETMLQKFLECLYQSARLNDVLFQRELTKGEFGVIEVVHFKHEEKGCPVSVNDLADTMLCRPPAISRILRGLEMKGFVERSINKEDRRGIHVTLTEEGEKIRRREESYQGDMFQKVVEKLGDEKLGTFLDVWREMLDTYVETAGDHGE